MKNYQDVIQRLKFFQARVLVNGEEVHWVAQLFEPDFPFAEAVAIADSIHLHIKVDPGDELPLKDLPASEAEIENQKEGYCKFATPSGLNMIFSSIPTSQDDLVETRLTRRGRPFLDHIGIDIRQDTDVSRQVFGRIPQLATECGWGHVGQGGMGMAVSCCHTEVGEKHWVYPHDKILRLRIPLEFALGPLKINPLSSGCDLRPFAPDHPSSSESAEACCEAGKC